MQAKARHCLTPVAATAVSVGITAQETATMF